MPVYNDWRALSLLLPILDRELKGMGLQLVLSRR